MTTTPKNENVDAYFRRQQRVYGRNAVIQQRIADRLMERILATAPPQAKILEVGAGGGELTNRLAAALPAARILATDILPEPNTGVPENVHWRTLDMNAVGNLGQPFDLAVSNCALHWATSLADTLRDIALQIQPQGVLISSLMSRGSLAKLHALRNEIAPEKMPLRSLPTTAEIQAAVEAANCRTLAVESLTFRETYASAKTMLTQLRRSAFTGGEFAHGSNLLTRSELRRLCAAYDTRFADAEGRVAANYEAVILVMSPA